MWIFIAIGAGVLVLAHTAPAPSLFDALAADRAVWHMPKRDPPSVYFTFDDGPNPTTTPDLLDVLDREHVRATFFLIDPHITERTAHKIVGELVEQGYLVKQRDGARNYYEIRPGVPIHDPLLEESLIGEILAVLVGNLTRADGRPTTGRRGSA